MQKQEPEQFQQDKKLYQEAQDYSEYRVGYSGRYKQKQQQIYPTEKRGLWTTVLVLSSVGFFFALVGTIAAGNVVEQCIRFAYQSTTLAGGIVELVCASVVMCLCIATFVLSLIALSKRARKARRPAATESILGAHREEEQS